MQPFVRRSPMRVLGLTLLLASLAACSTGREPSSPAPGPSGEDPIAALGDALTFHASFDTGVDADFARGDPRLYTAPSYDEMDQAAPGIGNPDVAVAEGAGRFGDALRFRAPNRHAIFYRADRNVAYSAADWSGTASFWLSLDPATDLEPGFSDPMQMTDRAFNDAAIWVDFTRENPRQFRLGLFGDAAAWNPGALPPNDHPWFLDRLLIVDQPPFRRDRWTHVVITFSGLNTTAGGRARLYLDGEPQPGTSTGITEPFTWDLARAAIRLGVNYVGLYDEISMFDRALIDNEVRALHDLEGGVAALHR